MLPISLGIGVAYVLLTNIVQQKAANGGIIMKAKRNGESSSRVRKALNKVVEAEAKMTKEIKNEALNIKMRNHWATIQKDLSLLSEDMSKGYSDIKNWIASQDLKNIIKQRKLSWK